MKILRLSLMVMGLTLHVSGSDDGAQYGIESTFQVDLIDQLSPENSDIPRTYEKRSAKGGYLRDGSDESRKIRPFTRYGPPRHTTITGFTRPQSPNEFNFWSHQPRKHPNDPPAPERMPPVSKNNEPHRNAKLEVPSPIRDVDFRDEDPIASQNNEPFQPNVANYLPPKNQKLPTLSIHVFQRPGPTHLPDNQHYTIHNAALKNENMKNYQSQISDATFFLIKNAEALSKLYGAPATNTNYPPFDNVQSPNGNDAIKSSQSFRNGPEQAKKTSPTPTVISLINTLQSSKQQGATRLSDQPYNIRNNVFRNEKIKNDHFPTSDGAFFSTKNAEVLSSFYGAPTATPTHPPFQNLQSPTGVSAIKSHQSFRSAPEWAKNPSQTSNAIISSLDSNKLTRLCCEDHRNGLKPVKLTHRGPAFSPNDWKHQLGTPGTNYPSPGDISSPLIPTTSTISTSHVFDLRSQGDPTVFPYPQYSALVPLITHVPSYGLTVNSGISPATAAIGDSPATHFPLPLPMIASERHPTPTAPTGVSGAFGLSHYHGSIPIQPPVPIQPVYPIIPSVNPIQDSGISAFPGYGAHTASLNSGF
ncbi:uncharacterized protein LOC135162460 [Diachasmimorpha longicaudata]|uniref:uncharacterized protein LOC135162460 n=1 Tax=Diachasmimorpha longicaudata TaxID=58733 RepID=UPI0030B89ACD